MITNIEGDVTKSKVSGLKILPHITNSEGKWSSGVVVPIARKWPNTKQEYLNWYDSTDYACPFNDESVPFMLGNVQFVQADDETIVANMVAQKGVGGDTINGKFIPPIRYASLREAMERVAELAKKLNAKIIAPWFGTLRAGGSKEVIKQMIEEIWGDLDVTMYEYKE